MGNKVKLDDSENYFTQSECADKSDWVLTLNTSKSRFCSTLLVQNYGKNIKLMSSNLLGSMKSRHVCSSVQIRFLIILAETRFA